MIPSTGQCLSIMPTTRYKYLHQLWIWRCCGARGSVAVAGGLQPELSRGVCNLVSMIAGTGLCCVVLISICFSVVSKLWA